MPKIQKTTKLNKWLGEEALDAGKQNDWGKIRKLLFNLKSPNQVTTQVIREQGSVYSIQAKIFTDMLIGMSYRDQNKDMSMVTKFAEMCPEIVKDFLLLSHANTIELQGQFKEILTEHIATLPCMKRYESEQLFERFKASLASPEGSMDFILKTANDHVGFIQGMYDIKMNLGSKKVIDAIFAQENFQRPDMQALKKSFEERLAPQEVEHNKESFVDRVQNDKSKQKQSCIVM